MKKILLLMFTITGLLFTTSCTDEGSDDAMLSISEKRIEFGKEAAEKSISVDTDAEKWSAIESASDWINLKIKGSKLVIMVAANETVYARRGRVLVVAGNTNATIEIMQAGLKGEANINPNEIIIGDTKGNISVEVDANDRKWTAESDVDWLKVTAKPHKGEMLLTYDQNMQEEERVAVITIAVGNDKTMIEARQLGRMYFLLPIRKLSTASYEEILEFEKKRGNTLDEQGSDKEVLSFKTRSLNMFPTMDYLFSEQGKLRKCVLLPKNTDTMEENLADFQQYLIANGFKEESPKDYVDEKNSVTAKIVFFQSFFGPLAHVEFKPTPKQDKAYPTFKEFPYGFIEWGAKKEAIDAYIAEKGGSYSDKDSRIGGTNEDGEAYTDDKLWYTFKKEDEAKTTDHIYYVNHDDQEKPGLVYKVELKEKTTFAFYQFEEEFLLTKEFKELCKQEGFKYKGLWDKNFHVFDHKEKKLRFAIRRVKFSDRPAPVLQLNIFENTEEEDAASYKVFNPFSEELLNKSAK